MNASYAAYVYSPILRMDAFECRSLHIKYKITLGVKMYVYARAGYDTVLMYKDE